MATDALPLSLEPETKYASFWVGAWRRFRRNKLAMFGIVDASKGYCRAPSEQNTLITLVTENVKDWYQRLKASGVKIDSPPKINETANVECFFFEGPGGYAFEVQRFLNPLIAEQFQSPD